MTIRSIDSPIEQRNTSRGKPAAIAHFDVELKSRQQKLLDALPGYGSRVTVGKKQVSMVDLAALTAKTGDEFAMFTRKNKRLIVRGDPIRVPITPEDASELNRKGFVWSGHTHAGTDMLSITPSDGDRAVLKCFDQEASVIYNSKGLRNVFWKDEVP